MLFEILLPVSQWVYDKSRVHLSLRRQRPRSLIRAIRNIRVPLTTQAAEPTDLIRAIRDITSRWSVGLRQISCSFKSPSTETSVSYSCYSRYSCSLNHTSSRAELGSHPCPSCYPCASTHAKPCSSFLLKFFKDFLRYFLHFVSLKLQMLLTEVNISLALHRNEVNMSMRNLQA